jgi:hypothetical protein
VRSADINIKSITMHITKGPKLHACLCLCVCVCVGGGGARGGAGGEGLCVWVCVRVSGSECVIG